jgi:hypothetical protein
MRKNNDGRRGKRLDVLKIDKAQPEDETPKSRGFGQTTGMNGLEGEEYEKIGSNLFSPPEPIDLDAANQISLGDQREISKIVENTCSVHIYLFYRILFNIPIKANNNNLFPSLMAYSPLPVVVAAFNQAHPKTSTPFNQAPFPLPFKLIDEHETH